MRTLLCATALVSLALLGAGCKKGPSLEGKWNGTVGQATVDAEFNADKSFSFAMKAGALNITQKGEYKLDADKLTLTSKDIVMPGLSPALLEQAKKSPEFSKPKVVDIKFASDDEFSLSNFPGTSGAGATQGITFKRVK